LKCYNTDTYYYVFIKELVNEELNDFKLTILLRGGNLYFPVRHTINVRQAVTNTSVYPKVNDGGSF
jgi:hypothetical protein